MFKRTQSARFDSSLQGGYFGDDAEVGVRRRSARLVNAYFPFRGLLVTLLEAQRR